MPGLTQTRVRLTLSQKVKIIEESKKSDFSKKKICEEYSISKATISSILKDQKTHLNPNKQILLNFFCESTNT